jgi:hypothetical protein
MQFFFVDFALALVALLGYRALDVVTRERVPAASVAGRLRTQPAHDPGITRPGSSTGRCSC